MHDLNEVQASGVLERSFVRTIGRPSGGRGAKKTLRRFCFFFICRPRGQAQAHVDENERYIHTSWGCYQSVGSLAYTYVIGRDGSRCFRARNTGDRFQYVSLRRLVRVPPALPGTQAEIVGGN